MGLFELHCFYLELIGNYYKLTICLKFPESKRLLIDTLDLLCIKVFCFVFFILLEVCRKQPFQETK